MTHHPQERLKRSLSTAVAGLIKLHRSCKAWGPWCTALPTRTLLTGASWQVCLPSPVCWSVACLSGCLFVHLLTNKHGDGIIEHVVGDVAHQLTLHSSVLSEGHAYMRWHASETWFSYFQASVNLASLCFAETGSDILITKPGVPRVC